MVRCIGVWLGRHAGHGRDPSAEGGPPAGQGLVEYALLLAFIAVVVIVALVFFGDRLTTLYSHLASSIPAT